MRALSPQAWRATAFLGVLAFWGGMWMAVRRYPSEYDWRYMTISSLVYDDRNPSGYLWARAGIVLCGLAGLYWATVLVRKEGQARISEQAVEGRTLGVGYLCMTCCALLPERTVGIPKIHDFLAVAAFVGICIGMVRTTFKAVERPVPLSKMADRHRVYAIILAGVPLTPIVLSALALAYVSHALPGLPWVSLAWRARGVPLYLSFAFWEWIICAAFSAYMVILPMTTRVRRSST